jgi:hypothetical protein
VAKLLVHLNGKRGYVLAAATLGAVLGAKFGITTHSFFDGPR